MGVTVVLADDMDAQAQARAVFDTVWPGDGTQITSNLMRAVMHSGGYCGLALDGDAVIGAAFGFPARADDGSVYLHSHMAAALDGYRDRGVGTLLKQHQRAWAQQQGIAVVAWTFDPLVRRNARVNIVRLGVRVVKFYPDFYGVMVDAINAGDRTDRLLAWWEVGSERAARAERGQLAPVSAARLREQGAVDLVQDSDGEPVSQGTQDYTLGLIALPEDVVAMRQADRPRSLRWRAAVREALAPAYARGLAVVAMSDESSYVIGDPVGAADLDHRSTGMNQEDS